MNEMKVTELNHKDWIYNYHDNDGKTKKEIK